MLLTLSRPFFEICCFSRGPQDLPASRTLLVLAIAGYLLANAALFSLTELPGAALAAAAAETGLMALFIYPAVALRGVPGRWLQTTTAMAGTGVLFSIAAIPLVAGKLPERSGAVAEILDLCVVLLVAWNVAVTAHIFRHALSASFVVGLLVAILYFWAVALAMIGLLPPAP